MYTRATNRLILIVEDQPFPPACLGQTRWHLREWVTSRSPSLMSSSMSRVVNVNVYNAQTFSFTLVTLLYSFTIVLACCTYIYYLKLYFYCSVNYHRAGPSITISKPSVGIYDPNITYVYFTTTAGYTVHYG